MNHFALSLGLNDPNRVVWLSKSAASGKEELVLSFIRELVDSVNQFITEGGMGSARNSQVVFALGREMRPKSNISCREVFGQKWKYDSVVSSARTAIEFFEFQLNACRKAVDAWTLVGIRFKVVKDIRRLIGKMIWDARGEAEYE
jgi:hypothetical protein